MARPIITAQEINAISDLADKEQAEYLRRSSIQFLECAVHLCATHMPMEAVAELLDAQAEMLREHG